MQDEKSFERLAKFCGMLGSVHDGERASAARKASELLKAMGMTWEDLVRAARGRQGPSVIDLKSYRPEPRIGRHVSLCGDMVRLHQGELTDWELSFLISLTTKFKFRELSEAQEASLARIVQRFYPDNQKKERS